MVDVRTPVTFGRYRHDEFVRACQENYPGEFDKDGTLDQGARELILAGAGPVRPPRFVSPLERTWQTGANPWMFPLRRDRHQSALALTYRGLICLKTPFDLALYTRLIWELAPRTIIEFGSYQGGSALWFADQLELLSSSDSSVQSFDNRSACISPSITNPRIRFHAIDLTDADDRLRDVLRTLPHPWLVVDDAHVDVLSLFALVDDYMAEGDYYVIEDVFLKSSAELAHAAATHVSTSGYAVDTDYADGFGRNVTCAPNAWLRKMA